MRMGLGRSNIQRDRRSLPTYLAAFPCLLTRTRAHPELIVIVVKRSIIEVHRFSGLCKNKLCISIKHTNHRTLNIQPQRGQLTKGRQRIVGRSQNQGLRSTRGGWPRSGAAVGSPRIVRTSQRVRRSGRATGPARR
jgi:hypothetical protein